jgi:hypothetical protein
MLRIAIAATLWVALASGAFAPTAPLFRLIRIRSERSRRRRMRRISPTTQERPQPAVQAPKGVPRLATLNAGKTEALAPASMLSRNVGNR